MLGSGLLRDGTSTEKEPRQRCSVDGDAGAAFSAQKSRWRRLGRLHVRPTK